MTAAACPRARRWLAALCLLVPLPALGATFQTPAIAPAELQALQGDADSPVVVDLRDPAEYRVGHVPGAVNIPEPQIEGRLGEIDPGRGVVLYCIAGKRTRAAEEILVGHGFVDVKHLDGGLTGWLDADLTVRKGAAP
jgi:rhodanese-related sulfurtransferase